MKYSKLAAALLILTITLCVFVYYTATQPDVLKQLQNLDYRVTLPILALYALFTFFLSLTVRISVALCDKIIGYRESFKLTSMSSLANFFGPLQSGPGVRALYLKKNHNIAIKKYGFATLYYYAMYALISLVFLLTATSAFRWSLVVMLPICVIAIIYIIKRRHTESAANIHPKISQLLMLLVATFLQLSCSVAIFWIELTAIGAQVSFGQALSYSGAANLALFVSLTPGAIGFREAFLVFSQSLHGVSSGDIIAANILDRAIYLVFLGLLFIWIGTTQAKKHLR